MAHVRKRAGVVAVLLVAGAVAGGLAQGGGNGPLDRMTVDPAAADRGRPVWAAECITCHGPNARGGEDGPNILRSPLLIRNRNGDTLGPFLKAGHPTQSGRPSAGLTEAQVVDLSHFLRQRFADTFRSSPAFVPGNVLVGDRAAGAAFFNGAGNCAGCHSPTGNLAGIGTRYDPVTIQQRLIFPMVGAARGRGAAPPESAVRVTIGLPGAAKVSGDLVEMDDFFVTYRGTDGLRRTVRRTPGMTVDLQNRFAAHIALLDTITDKQMHDLVAYLETLK